jgi:hypothetical protein
MQAVLSPFSTKYFIKIFTIPEESIFSNKDSFLFNPHYSFRMMFIVFFVPFVGLCLHVLLHSKSTFSSSFSPDSYLIAMRKFWNLVAIP